MQTSGTGKTRARTCSHSLRGAEYYALALCLLGFTASCARSRPVQQSVADATDAPLPFHNGSEKIVDDKDRPAVPPSQPTTITSALIPASRSHIFPAGTLVTVRLAQALPLRRIRAGDEFLATVAEPLIIDGDTLLDNGSPASGRIEFVQPPVVESRSRPHAGYARLVLTSITLHGRTIALQTSSLFAKAALKSAAGGTNSFARGFRLPRGRLLTFRLSAPFTIPDAVVIARR